jgi:hypothetical protein
MLDIAERLSGHPQSQLEIFRRFLNQFSFDLRCAAPGIITSFDSDKQTVTVQLAIKEIIQISQKENTYKKAIEIPEILDVPIIIPRAGGYSITLPVKKGDECLVIFGDTCIDSWWKRGCPEQTTGKYLTQDPASLRRHDLSDGFAILGCWSQPNVISEYSTDSLEIRTDDGNTKIKVKDGEVTIISDSIKLGDTSGLRKLIDERIINLFNLHTHPYVNVSTPSTTSAPTTPLLLTDCSTTKTEGI